MKNYFSKLVIGLVLAAIVGFSLQAQAYLTCGDVNRLRCITLTTAAVNGTLGATTPSTAAVTSLTTTLGATHTRTPAADSGTTNNASKVLLTTPIDTTGTNTHNAYDVALTVSNATGGTNQINGFKFENYTGDAQDNVTALAIGTSDGLGTAYGLDIGTGWDAGINLASPLVGTSAANITINTNKFTVAASSGNTVVAGTLGVTGALTATGGVDGVLGGVTPALATVTTLNKVTVTAPASSATLTIPNGTTLTASAASGTEVAYGASVACGSTCTLGAANLNGYTQLNTAGGSAATLPTATGSGATYRMYISVATTSAQDKVLLTTVTDTIIGTAQGENAGTAKVFVGNAGTYHSIQMPFAGTQPSGGFIGDTITCTDVASTIYKCDIQYQAGTTPTTPYSTSTT